MKKLLMALICLTGTAQASPFTGCFGNDAGSFGGIVVHDFKSQGTLSGVQWDALHVAYKTNEIAEAGAFGVRRDGDNHFLAGPSFGVPGGDLASVATAAQRYFDWPFLKAMQDYGGYLHAYVNIGWDLSQPRQLHISPDLIGLGGVLKFGK